LVGAGLVAGTTALTALVTASDARWSELLAALPAEVAPAALVADGASSEEKGWAAAFAGAAAPVLDNSRSMAELRDRFLAAFKAVN